MWPDSPFRHNFHRVRCSTQDFCSHVSRRVRFRVQGRPLFPAAKPLSMLEWMVTMLWIQLQAEGRVTPTNCAIPFTSAPNTWQNCNQIFPDTLTTWPSERRMKTYSNWWKLVQTRPYISTVSFDKTSAGPLHLVQVLALPPDNWVSLNFISG